MKKYISILLAVVLSASLLAGCGGGSGNSEQKPATEAKEDTDANTNSAAGFYQIYVIDAATLILLKAQGCSSVPILPA